TATPPTAIYTLSLHDALPILGHHTRGLKSTGPVDDLRKGVDNWVNYIAEATSQRAALEAMKERIADAMDNPNTSARDLAPLARLLIELLEKLHDMDKKEGDDSDREWQSLIRPPVRGRSARTGE